jgi:hypothetical protein
MTVVIDYLWRKALLVIDATNLCLQMILQRKRNASGGKFFGLKYSYSFLGILGLDLVIYMLSFCVSVVFNQIFHALCFSKRNYN